MGEGVIFICNICLYIGLIGISVLLQSLFVLMYNNSGRSWFYKKITYEKLHSYPDFVINA